MKLKEEDKSGGKVAVIPALGMLSQSSNKFKASLGFIVPPRLVWGKDASQ